MSFQAELSEAWSKLVGAAHFPARVHFKGHQEAGPRAELEPRLRALADLCPGISQLSSPAREGADWVSSRECAADGLEALLAAGVPAHECVLSLAHTRDASVAVVARGVGFRAGVDLEPAGRAISAAAAKRFVHASEAGMGLAPLELWVLKEAAYKAHPENGETLIPDYRVKDAKTVSAGGVELSYRVLRFQSWLVGFAALL